MNARTVLILALVVTLACSFSEAGNYWQMRGRQGRSNLRTNFRKRIYPFIPIRPEMLERVVEDWDNG